MLIGIVVKNGIVLIDYITLNRERGVSIRSAVIDGGRSRLRPVVMTTLTTILGAWCRWPAGTGEGAEMWRPIGTAVIGGLTFSTILTLLFVPVFYCVFAHNGVKRTRKKTRKPTRPASDNPFGSRFSGIHRLKTPRAGNREPETTNTKNQQR